VHCVECGAEFPDDALFCPECGANPHLQATRKSGCRRLLPLVWGVLAVLLALAFLALAAWRGAVEGRQQWQANAKATADAWYAQAQTYLAEGKWQLAMAACRYADDLKPGYPGAVECYATAVIALTPTPTPTPTPVVVRAQEDIWADAQARFEAGDWSDALDALNELWQRDPSFRADQTSTMRYTALISLGRESLAAGRLEEAIYYLDQAAVFGALDAELETERQLAARYVNALNYCGVDWAECTSRMADLYATYPTYRDVFNQLHGAYLDWAEAMAGIQEWCPAEVHYGQAWQLRSDSQVETKRADAAQRCLLATPTPIPGQITGTITVTVEGFTVGRLSYSAYNSDLGAYELYTLSAYDQRLSRVASSAGQPNWRRDGSMLLYRGVQGLQAAPTAGGEPLLLSGDTAAFWPSWSPDGGRIAYARQEADGWRIYAASVDGSTEPQSLALGKYPIWGPQGALAFSGCVIDGAARGVCVMNPDDPGAAPVPLTSNPDDTPVSWSPDGFNIAYMSDHGGDWDIFMVNTAGGVVLLTPDDALPASDGLPAWAPDGSAIAFVSNREGSWGLYLMSPDGNNVRQLLNIGAQHPNWLIERLAWGP